jgi:hypothetical protein
MGPVIPPGGSWAGPMDPTTVYSRPGHEGGGGGEHQMAFTPPTAGTGGRVTFVHSISTPHMLLIKHVARLIYILYIL